LNSTWDSKVHRVIAGVQGFSSPLAKGMPSSSNAAWDCGGSRFHPLGDATPDHSTISRNRRLIDLEARQEVFTWVLGALAGVGAAQRQDGGD